MSSKPKFVISVIILIALLFFLASPKPDYLNPFGVGNYIILFIIIVIMFGMYDSM